MAERFVLDTSAWLALDESEPGGDEVEVLLADAWCGKAELHACFATLAELEYIRTRERNALKAAELIAWAKAQPVSWQHSDDALCSAAAKLKAANKLSFADAFIAALAQQLDATLVHKDPEIEALGAAVKQQMLRLKTRPAA